MNAFHAASALKSAFPSISGIQGIPTTILTIPTIHALRIGDLSLFS